MSYWFCSKFHILSSSAKILKIGKDLTKLQRVSRWELFFETQCICLAGVVALSTDNINAKYRNYVTQRAVHRLYIDDTSSMLVD